MKWMIGGIVLAVVLTASAGCGESKLLEETGTVQETQTYSSQEEPSRTAEPAQTEEESPVPEADFESLAALLGMEDAETADLLGGGKENWTEDRSFYIGRIYAVTLFGQEYPVYTSCDENGVVNSVSIWLEDGERTVPEEEARQWADRLTEFTGTEPAYDSVTSEGGSRNWKWDCGDKFISLHWMDTILSISMNPAVGELR